MMAKKTGGGQSKRSIPMGVRLPIDVYAWVQGLADEHGVSIASVIVAALQRAQKSGIEVQPIKMGRPQSEV